MCLGIGAVIGAGLTYLAMKDESEDVSDTSEEFSGVFNEDCLIDDEDEMDESLGAATDRNLGVT